MLQQKISLDLPEYEVFLFFGRRISSVSPVRIEFRHIDENRIWAAYATSGLFSEFHPTRSGKIYCFRAVESMVKSRMIATSEGQYEFSRTLDHSGVGDVVGLQNIWRNDHLLVPKI